MIFKVYFQNQYQLVKVSLGIEIDFCLQMNQLVMKSKTIKKERFQSDHHFIILKKNSLIKKEQNIQRIQIENLQDKQQINKNNKNISIMEERKGVQEIQIEDQINDPAHFNIEKQQNDQKVFSYNLKSKKKYQKIIEKLEKIKRTQQKKKNKYYQKYEQDIEGDDYSEVKKNQEKLKILKEIMSSVPAYLLMSPAQKRKYFKSVNSQFYETLQKELGSQCSHSKSVQFDLEKNKIKTFKQSDNVFEISQSII